MDKNRQHFYDKIKLRFYLHTSNPIKPGTIYLLTYIDGKHYRYSTRLKVYPNQWYSEKQLAVISNVQSQLDNHNNTVVNEQLKKYRRYFAEFLEHISNNYVSDISGTLKHFIFRDNAKTKLVLMYVAAEALEYYHKYVRPSIKESTKRQNESLLSEFGRFVDTLPKNEKTMQIFSQKGLNMYKEYLIDKMNKSKTDGKMRNFGVGQLNRCGAIIAMLINKVFVPREIVSNSVVWIKVEDPRREDQMGYFPLFEDEVAAIDNCSGLTPIEEEYRDIFLLHIECGQRVSDLAKLLIGKYSVKQGKRYNYMVVTTTKENIKAIIPLTSRMRMLMNKVKNQKLVNPIEFERKTKGKGNNTYNEAIRRIARKAGLNRTIIRIDSTQKEVKKPLYETITSHYARCTFITNMIKNGESPDEVRRMSGHASDEMIRTVYAQLTDDEIIKNMESRLKLNHSEEGTTKD